MLRYCMFSWTLHSCVMLRYCLFSWTLQSGVMLRTPPWHIMINMCSCGVGVQTCRVQILKGPWKIWRRCSDQKTAKNMRQRISFRLATKPKNGSFVLAKWLFSSYCLWIMGWRPQKKNQTNSYWYVHIKHHQQHPIDQKKPRPSKGRAPSLSLLFLMVVDCCRVCHSAVCCQSAVFSAVPHNGLPTNGATDGQLTSIPWMVGASPRLRHAILIVKHC